LFVHPVLGKHMRVPMLFSFFIAFNGDIQPKRAVQCFSPKPAETGRVR